MDQKEKANLLRRLHAGADILVLPNAWDAASARVIEAEGFPAVATSSAGVAAVLGYADGQHIPRREMLFLIERIARTVDVPVTADIEAGYGDPAETAREVIAAGAVGMNLEDMEGATLVPLSEQIKRIQAVRAANSSLVLNARTDLFLAQHGDASTRFNRAVERLNAYREAGADCLFAPGVVDMPTILSLVSAVKGPLNILATVGSPSISEMRRAGVRRVSLGSGPSRVALGGLRRFVHDLRADGNLTPLETQAIPYADVQKLLSRGTDRSKVMRLSDFDYHLPEELIAQEPPTERDAARMLVLHRSQGTFEDRHFRDLPTFLRGGDCLVLNDSRVLPSRLFGHRAGVHSLPVGENNPKKQENLSGAVEVLLLEPVSPNAREWHALVRPGRKMRTGEIIRFDDGFSAEIIARGERGERTLRFLGHEDVYAAIDRLGHMPLPPYIKRDDRPIDRDRYQTVFAREHGSAAAPTAGLHFTGEILDRCQAAGARIARVTLHVGLGTFQPIDTEDFEHHELHYERYSIPGDSWNEIESARRAIAVGTTSVRTIESAARSGERAGLTNLFIYPGYEFQRTGAMLTNFHLPRTSLLLLVCAFAGTDLTLAAYRHAVEQKYRFFSYGDCMLIV